MKPFNLELAKAGHPVQTRDGLKARIVCYNVKGAVPILALISKGDYEFEAYYDIAGRSDNSSLDLFMSIIKTEGWVNIHQNLQSGNCNYWASDVYNSKEEALLNKQLNYVTTIKIEWEE